MRLSQGAGAPPYRHGCRSGTPATASTKKPWLHNPGTKPEWRQVQDPEKVWRSLSAPKAPTRRRNLIGGDIVLTIPPKWQKLRHHLHWSEHRSTADGA